MTEYGAYDPLEGPSKSHVDKSHSLMDVPLRYVPEACPDARYVAHLALVSASRSLETGALNPDVITDQPIPEICYAIFARKTI